MKFKLDENLGVRCTELFKAAGHDTATVAGEGITSVGDDVVIETCRREGRALVTLDLDFSNPFIFPPEQYAGIAVLRLPSKPTADDLIAAVRTLISAIGREELVGRLWSVEAGRIRVYQPST